MPKGNFPNAEKVGECLVTLPINPRQTREALDYLIESVRTLSADSSDLDAPSLRVACAGNGTDL